MSTDLLWLLAALALFFLLWLLLRRPRVEPPAQWLERLEAIEARAQAVQLALAKNDGAMDALARQLDALRQAVDERLAQAVGESRHGRSELLAAFDQFEARLAQRFDGLQQAVAGRLEESSKALLAHLAQGQADAAAARKAMGESAAQLEQRIQQRFEALTAATRLTLDSLKGDVQGQLAAMQDALARQLAGLVQGSQHSAEQLRNALNERLGAIQADNASRLEAMRRTVDEKLHATLEQRLGESFKLVSERLEQVHKGLGEMQTLAGSVGDLKRVMSNVKSRGVWGEMQLGAIIDNVLTAEQFARNVKTVPGSDELVEFAIRLPGKSAAQPVWLPIDSKFPLEQYQRLLDAQDAADKAAAQSAGNALETSVRFEARKIFAKYVAPPHTTDFAILYLPTESLFAEVLRRPGLVEAVQNECRVMITGPANLAAMLNSLQMGFKTLAIEQRSSEVWSLLGTVKTEFAKFGEVVEATKKSIDAAAKKFDEVGVRTRVLQRKLREVQDLPAPVQPDLAGLSPEAAGLPTDAAQLQSEAAGAAASTHPGPDAGPEPSEDEPQ